MHPKPILNFRLPEKLPKTDTSVRLYRAVAVHGRTLSKWRTQFPHLLGSRDLPAPYGVGRRTAQQEIRKHQVALVATRTRS